MISGGFSDYCNTLIIFSTLAFRFSLFIHGESSVVASVDVQENAAVRLLNRKDLQKTSVLVGNADSKGEHIMYLFYMLLDADIKIIKQHG